MDSSMLVQMMEYIPDPVQFVLDKPMVDSPGSVYNYGDGASHGSISRRMGLSLPGSRDLVQQTYWLYAIAALLLVAVVLGGVAYSQNANEQEVHVPESLKATVARLQQAEVVFLPASRQLVPGRRIVGATIRTRDLDALQRVLSDASWSVPAVVPTTNGRSMFVPPSTAHGIWLEFRQEQGG